MTVVGLAVGVFLVLFGVVTLCRACFHREFPHADCPYCENAHDKQDHEELLKRYPR